jgi:rare lipoprotein A
MSSNRNFPYAGPGVSPGRFPGLPRLCGFLACGSVITMKAILVCAALLFGTVCFGQTAKAARVPSNGVASWYGESHRGKLMANGKRFNPDRPTAASWFYPLGTKVRVTIQEPYRPARSVLVTVTDRGPAHRLVRDGRIIDLAHGAFKQIAPPDTGLVWVKVEVVSKNSARG